MRPDEVEIWSFNSSGAPQLQAAVRAAQELGANAPIAILNQEHHADDERYVDLQATLKKSGWSCAGAKAVRTAAGGRSAGVAVATPAHVPAACVGAPHADRSPRLSPGRLAAEWIQDVVPSGISAVSAYLHDTEGPTPRNFQLLANAIETARAAGCPWIIALDGQQEPAQLLGWAAPLVAATGASLVHTTEATHFPGHGVPRCIDYFIVDERLLPAVREIRIIEEFCYHEGGQLVRVPARPHRAVKLVLRTTAVQREQTVLKTPKSSPGPDQ